MKLFAQVSLCLPVLAQVSDARRTAAVPRESPELCVRSCDASLKPLRFVDADATALPFRQACQSRLAVSSKYLCLRLNCGTRTCDAAIQHHNTTCYDSFGSPIPAFRTNYTDEEVAGLKKIGKGDTFGSDKPLTEVVIPSYDRFNTWFETLDAVEYAHRLHHLYGIGVMVFWTVVVFVGLGNKAYVAASQIRSVRQSFDVIGLWTETRSWFKRNVAIPATFGYRCAQNVWWATIPSRMQTLTITVFLLMNVVFCVHGYRIIDDNIYFGTPIRQVLRYAADRTGIVSFANFPFVWLFGMRNNLAIWLTGWDFGTYNNFHRWCARISTLEAVVHSIFYTILIFMNGGWNYYAWWFTMWFWNAGQIATISMCLLLVFSVYWIRRRFYEAFLLIHIGLSILILFTMLGHVSIFNEEYDALFWIPAFIWVFDRAMRLLRIIIYSPGQWSTTALASYSQSANIIRLSIPVDKALYKPRSGNYFYLTVLDDKRFWESHPFTIASLSGDLPPKAELTDENEGVPLLASATNPSEAGHGGIDVEPKKQHMTFLIRPYDSFSGRLRDMLTDEQLTPAPVRVLVDGPYGHTQRLHQYQRVLFIAGGSGVVVALSYLNTLCHEAKASSIVELHWAVREPKFAGDVLAKEAKDAIATGRLSVHLYVSSQTDASGICELPSQVEQHIGRPNIRAIVMSAASGARNGDLAVVACGPARMADDARLAVVGALREGNHHIDYYEESFTW
ncbi:ferric reductase like transmembrane component domain-containing protein [Trichoderma gracile]